MYFKPPIRLSNTFYLPAVKFSRCTLSTTSSYEFLTYSKKQSPEKSDNNNKTDNIQSFSGSSYDAIIVGGGLSGLTAGNIIEFSRLS